MERIFPVRLMLKPDMYPLINFVINWSFIVFVLIHSFVHFFFFNFKVWNLVSYFDCFLVACCKNILGSNYFTIKCYSASLLQGILSPAFCSFWPNESWKSYPVLRTHSRENHSVNLKIKQKKKGKRVFMYVETTSIL